MNFDKKKQEFLEKTVKSGLRKLQIYKNLIKI